MAKTMSIDVTSLMMLVAVVLLIWIIADMVMNRKKASVEKPSPVIVRDVDVYEPVYGWEWWPWNWSTRPWGGGSYGNAWFGPGKPCRGWNCEKEHVPHAPHPITINQNNMPQSAPMPVPSAPAQVPSVPIQEGPIQTLPIQDIPVQPPTAQQDIQVALAPTPSAIQPETSNIGTQTDVGSTEPIQ